MASGRRDPERERFWRNALRRQRGSGLSVRAFCARERLAETAFFAWRRILRQRDDERREAAVGSTSSSSASAAPAPAFLPVVVREGRREPADKRESARQRQVADQRDAAPREAAGGIVIELRGGRAMRLAASMPVESVARLVRAIEAADADEDRGAS